MVDQGKPVIKPGNELDRQRQQFLWTNPLNRLDVNADGLVTASDALAIINYINQNGSITIDPFTDPNFFYDVNADGSITQDDVLAVINGINSAPSNQSLKSINNYPQQITATIANGLRKISGKTAANNRLIIADKKRNTVLPNNTKTSSLLQNTPVLQNSGTSSTSNCIPCRFTFDIGQTLGDPYNGSGGSFILRLVSADNSLDLPPIQVINSRLNRINRVDTAPNDEYPNQEQIIKQAIITGFNSDPNWPNLGSNDVTVDSSNTGSGQFRVTIYRVPEGGITEITTPAGRVTTFEPFSGAVSFDGHLTSNLITAHTQVIGLPVGTISAKWVDMFGIPATPSLRTPEVRYRFLTGKVVIMFRKRSDINLGQYNNYYETQEIDIINTSILQLEQLLNNTMSTLVLGVPNGFVVGTDTTPNVTDPINNNRFYIGVRNTVAASVPSSEDLFEIRFVDAIQEFPGYMNLLLIDSGDCTASIDDNPCQLSNMFVRMDYNLLPQRPINIYSVYAKYVMRDIVNPTIKGVVAVPITNWSGLNSIHAQTPCSLWFSNTIPPRYVNYNMMDAGDILTVTGVEEFITPVMGIGGSPTEISSSVPLPDDDIVGRLTSGDARCTRTRNDPNYRPCVVESIEILMLSAIASNLIATPPFIEQVFEEELVYFDPDSCDNLDIVFAVDNSGSMGNVINDIRSSIDQIIDFVGTVSPQSTIGLVRYGQGASNGEPDVVLGCTPVETSTGRTAIRNAVQQYAATGGNEPHGAATTLALNELIKVSAPDRSQVIILVSDEPFDAGGETIGQLQDAASNAALFGVSIFGIHVGNFPGNSANNIYQYMIDMAQITNGAAVRQSDGIIVDPLIKLLSRFCLSSANTSNSEVVTPNQCVDDPNPNDITITLEFNAEHLSGVQQFSHTINAVELIQTTGDADFWTYNQPSGGIDYNTRPSGIGNWLNYPPSPLQGVSMQQARWEGFKLLTDLTDGNGVIQCTGINVRVIEATGSISLPTLAFFPEPAAVARCFTEINITRINSLTQRVALVNTTGGNWQLKYGSVTTRPIPWDATPADVQNAIEALPGVGFNGVVVTQNAFQDYTITWASRFGEVATPTGVDNLTCTDQEITVVAPGPYNYELPKPGPNINVDSPDDSCLYCPDIITNTIKLHYERINAGCDTRARSLACRFTKSPSNYSVYQFSNGKLKEVPMNYEAIPGDKIIIINNSVEKSNILLNKITRSFEQKL